MRRDIQIRLDRRDWEMVQHTLEFVFKRPNCHMSPVDRRSMELIIDRLQDELDLDLLLNPG
jgi:hypothetical protein